LGFSFTMLSLTLVGIRDIHYDLLGYCLWICCNNLNWCDVALGFQETAALEGYESLALNFSVFLICTFIFVACIVIWRLYGIKKSLMGNI
jgi:thiosulfate reductase cytochrome b subunit